MPQNGKSRKSVEPINPQEVFKNLHIDATDIMQQLQALRMALSELRRGTVGKGKSMWYGDCPSLMDLNTSVILEHAGVEIVDAAIKALEVVRNKQ